MCRQPMQSLPFLHALFQYHCLCGLLLTFPTTSTVAPSSLSFSTMKEGVVCGTTTVMGRPSS